MGGGGSRSRSRLRGQKNKLLAVPGADGQEPQNLGVPKHLNEVVCATQVESVLVGAGQEQWWPESLCERTAGKVSLQFV